MRLIDADKAVEQIDDIFSVDDGWGMIPVGMTKALVRSMLTLEGITPTVDTDINVPCKWIGVKDRLPDTEDHVLCCTQTKAGRQNVVIGYYMDGAWRCGMNSNVTHWMPLPTPPGGES